MDEKCEFENFVDGVAKHLKDNCHGMGVMIIVHTPGAMAGIEMWVNTNDPLFSTGLLKLATLAVDDSVRSRTVSHLRTASASQIVDEAGKEKQRMN
jgi:hypothetical protein